MSDISGLAPANLTFAEADEWYHAKFREAGWKIPANISGDHLVRLYHEATLTNGDGRSVRHSGSDPELEFQTLAELCAEVDAMGPRRWLIRGIWPAGVYGVHGAEMKAQKTWNALDLAVSVASGTPWLGSIPIDDSGPVVIFAGEGGKPSIVRRIRAIAKSRGLTAEELPIVVCARAPHLSNDGHLALVAAQLQETKPRLVVLDPLYLAARGAKGTDLYAMGEMLEPIQHLCEQATTALLVVTHYNRKEGSGPSRFTGAGPAEWGRVLIGAAVVSRHTDPDTMQTTVIVDMAVIGGDIPDRALRLKREIHADDPADLDSPLHYHVEILASDDARDQGSDLAPAAQKLLEAFDAQDGPATSSELVDAIQAKHGHGLRRETVSRHLNALAKGGVVICTNPDAPVTTPKLWERVVTDVMSHVTAHQGEPVVTDVISPIEITRNGHTSRSHAIVDDVDDAEVTRLLAKYGDQS